MEHPKILQDGITFDDVLLIPARGSFVPNDADTHTRLTRGIELNIPLISAPMDTVTESALAIALAGLLFGQMTAAALLIFFGVLLTLSNNILSFASHAYQAELYPTRIRALAVGFVYSWSRISVVFSSFVIGFVLDRFGVPGVFTLIAGSMLMVMLAIGIFGPRTNNLALETISQEHQFDEAVS